MIFFWIIGIQYHLALDYFITVSKIFQSSANSVYPSFVLSDVFSENHGIILASIIYPCISISLCILAIFDRAYSKYLPIGAVCCAMLPYVYQRLGTFHLLIVFPAYLLAFIVIIQYICSPAKIMLIVAFIVMAIGLSNDGGRELQKLHRNPMYKYRNLADPLNATTSLSEWQEFYLFLNHESKSAPGSIFAFCTLPQIYTFSGFKQAGFVNFLSPWPQMSPRWKEKLRVSLVSENPIFVTVDNSNPFFASEYPDIANWISKNYEDTDQCLGNIRLKRRIK